ncbi:acyltransferase family protein [Zhongshania aquimaris]|uniref:Acyltransferase n=1 Tax=Zhongshania aquimaris TaxID=2857107 RepID=A0ABS6VN37_9GAMM|nr:acyltransferase family protein [Zhongshania aquimaris]MBW2939739.1 acyltransferase [Zhongshania aquimaris]
MIYRKDLDGLRGVAVLLALLFHSHTPGFSGGFVGVDLFFAISGFLITTILLREQEDGRFSLVNFYERRVRRILPALYTILFLSSFGLALILTPEQMEEYSKSLLSVVFFVSNIFYFNQGSYFGVAVEQMPLLHTWSLAVEEQFYIFYPLALYVAFKYFRQHMLKIVVVITILAFFFSIWAGPLYPKANFYFAPTRAWQLFIGAIAAVLLYSKGGESNENNLLSFIGLMMICGAVFFLDRSMLYPSYNALLPSVGTFLIIMYGGGNTIAGYVLRSKPLVFVGLMSFSLYLWHNPFFAGARILGYDESNRLLYLGMCLVSGVLAYFTWKYIETPFRHKAIISSRRVWQSALVSTFVVLPLGVLGTSGKLDTLLWNDAELSVLDYAKYYKANEYPCFLMPNQPIGKFPEECAPEDNKEWLLWGDSHAASIFPGLNEVWGGEVAEQYTVAACPPILDLISRYNPSCRANNDAIFSLIEKSSADKVILMASWYGYKDAENWPEKLEVTINRIKATGRRVIVLGPLPWWRPDLPHSIARKMRAEGVDLSSIDEWQEVTLMPELLDAESKVADAARRSDVEFYSLIDLLCEAGSCLAFSDISNKRVPLSWDYAHLTEEGAIFIGRKLSSKIGKKIAEM